MKLRVYRQSGSPINPESEQLYNAEYGALYDKCELKASSMFVKEHGKLKRIPRMIMLQRLLRFAERSLIRKYGGNDEVELPKTAKAWTALINKYGETPLMLAKEQNSGRLVLLLMDNLQE